MCTFHCMHHSLQLNLSFSESMHDPLLLADLLRRWAHVHWKNNALEERSDLSGSTARSPSLLCTICQWPSEEGVDLKTLQSPVTRDLVSRARHTNHKVTKLTQLLTSEHLSDSVPHRRGVCSR